MPGESARRRIRRTPTFATTDGKKWLQLCCKNIREKKISPMKLG
jgi:hypothetical protein